MITHMSNGDPIPDGVEIGTFTISSDASSHTITHSLGRVPNIAICVCVFAAYTDLANHSILLEGLNPNIETGVFDWSTLQMKTVYSYDSRYKVLRTYGMSDANLPSMTDTQVTFVGDQYNSGFFAANSTYLYILV